MMITLVRASLIALLLAPLSLGVADAVGRKARQSMRDEFAKIIVHPQNRITELRRDELARIYSGRRTLWNSDIRILPVLLVEESPVTRFFLEDVLATTVTEYRSYWRRRLYSGGGAPPTSFQTSAEIVDFVAKNQGAIGVVEGPVADSRVKVIRWNP